MKKATYIKCPRCELNYIKSTDKFCHVCLTELRLAGDTSSVEEDLELCPICGQNFISSEQKMCEDCFKQKGIDLEYDEDREDDEREVESAWEDDESSMNEEVELIPLSAMEDDEDDDEDDESEEEDSDKPSAYEDDFEPAYLDEDDDFEDDDYEDDEDDDEDDDDYDY